MFNINKTIQPDIINMFWTDKIELVISLSFLLILLPCLVAYSTKPLPQGIPFQMGLLISGMDVLAAEIVILLLLALYLACREHKIRLPNALAFSKCMRGTYQPTSIANTSQKLNATRHVNHFKQEHQSITWQLMSKQEMIFK